MRVLQPASDGRVPHLLFLVAVAMTEQLIGDMFQVSVATVT